MDNDEDIKKIEAFLQQLEHDESRESQHSSSDLKSTSKRHKPNDYSSIESEERVQNAQRSLKYNRECQSLLNSIERCILYLLDECVKERKIVSEAIDLFENRKATGSKLDRNSQVTALRKACTSPYFKDQQGFPSKLNEDFFFRKISGYLNPQDAIRTVPWTTDQKRILEKSIKNYEKSVSQSSSTLKDTNHDKPSPTTTYINDLIDPKEEKYDWIKISVVDLNNARSPLECRAMWFNYLHPKINKKNWSGRENNYLKTLVERNDHQNWEHIARGLKNNRTAYQCIGHYKITLADFSKISWSAGELKQLEKLVKKLKVNDFTPWYKIAWLMDGRSTADIYRNWISRYGALKRGPFSLQEDLILAAGLKEFGQDWCRIAQYLPDRHNIQVRSHILTLKSREHCCIPWTESEDELLENLVKKYGFGNWAKISSHFITRDNVQVRTRYRTLTKLKEKLNAGATLKSVGCRLSKNRIQERNLNALWEVAVKLVEDKNVDNETKKLTSQANITYALSQIFKPRKKPGRKKGSVNYPTYHEAYYKFFHVAHRQRGGRGKEICAEGKVPTLVHQIVLALQLLDANIVLPSVKESVYKDKSLLEMDKSVIIYLIDRKELVRENCKFIRFEDDPCSSNELSRSSSMEKSNSEVQERSEFFPLCSPCASTLIGFRTMLLNRVNIKEQSKGITVQGGKISRSIPMQDSTKSSRFRSACKLWNKRIGILYTWAALLSKSYPEGQFIFEPPTVEKNNLSGAKNKVRKKGKKKINKSIGKSGSMNDQSKNVSTMVVLKPKRAYVKSGKFKMRNQVTGSTRRNTRLTKTDL